MISLSEWPRAAKLVGFSVARSRLALLPEVQGVPAPRASEEPAERRFFRFWVPRYTHRRQRSTMIPGSRDGHTVSAEMRPGCPQGARGASGGAGVLLKLTRSSQGPPRQEAGADAAREGGAAKRATE